MSKVTQKFMDRKIVGDSATIPPKQVLSRAADYGLTEVVVVGVKNDGEIYLAGSHGAPDTALLLLLGQAELVGFTKE